MRRSLTFFLSAFHVLLFAQGGQQALLWQVTQPAMRDTSYLFGTMHTRDARAFQFGPEVSRAFIRCEIVAGELDMEETKRLGTTLAGAMFLPAGSTLDRYYSKREYKQVMNALREELGPLAVMGAKMRPFYLMAMLSEVELGKDSALVLDDWLQKQGRAMDKSVVGLETIKEQIDAVDRIPLEEQARMLLQQARMKGRHADAERALKNYVDGDLEALLAQMVDDGLGGPADKALLQDRNLRMIERMQEHMQGHGVFVAVGAAHLPGEHGLIEHLRRLGYTVLPVVREPALPEQAPWKPLP
ncbi:MAG: TraB/GumN family protein [Flavobacteriales bacterium]|nr:TraB/GumN family protein [Flavobacteriales bacterium]